MTAKQIRSKSQALAVQREKIEAALGRVQQGGRSADDAIAAVERGCAEGEARLKKAIADELIGKSPYSARETDPHFDPAVNLRHGFDPVRSLSQIGLRLGGTENVVALLLSTALKDTIRDVLENDVPRAALGPSQAERDAEERRLRKELERLDAEQAALEREWRQEVGDDVPLPI